MGATSSAGGTGPTKDYERAEGGVYPGRCVHVIELGTHDNTYQGETKQRKELMIVWEINELMEDGRPFTVYWRGTNSLNDKAKLYKHLCDWRGGAFTPDELNMFELKNILDQTCLINITLEKTKNDRPFNRVQSIMSLPKGTDVNDRHNPLVDFGISDLGTEEFEKLWPWVQKIVKESYEGIQFYASEAPMNTPEDGNNTGSGQESLVKPPF